MLPFAIALLLFSALAVAATTSWTPLDRAVLVAHVVLGVLVVPPALVGLYRHLRRRLPGLRPRTALAILGILAIGFLLPTTPVGAIPPGLAAVLNGGLLVCGVVVWRDRRGWLGPEARWNRATVVEVVHLVLWSLAAVTGPLLVLLGGGRALAPLFRVHAFFGTTMLVLGTAWLLGMLRRQLRDAPDAAAVPRGRRARRALAAAVLVAAALVAARGTLPSWTTQDVVVHLSVLPWAARAPAERDPRPLAFDPALLSLTRSCGGGEGEDGCHAGLVRDHARSSHARSLRPAHVERNLAQLVAETGDSRDTAACMGCHFPRGLAAPDGVARVEPDAPHVSCVECHAVAAVELPADRARSAIRLRLDAAALAPFVRAEQADGRLDRWNRWLLDLDPGAHGRAFTPATLAGDDLCLVCHRAQIEPSPGAPSCNTCHMPPRAELLGVERDGPEALERSHLFPGTNVALPALLGDDATARVVRDWMASDLYADELPLRAYGVDPPQPVLGAARRADFFYLDLHVEPAEPPARGRPFRFAVRTVNRFVGHGFPAGPMDLNESWLEVRVRDAAGRTLLASGGLDDAHHLLPGTRRFGGHAVDAAGEPIHDYRVWAMAREVIERQLHLGESATDAFEVEVPPDAGGWIEVEARWLHRELGQAFVDRSYGPGVLTMPVVEVARAFWQAPLP